MDRDILRKGAMRIKIGEYLLDVSKLVFGGSVLSTVLEIDNLSKGGILITSIGAVLFLALLGFFLIKEER